MNPQTKNYFRHLGLTREDVREELALMIPLENVVKVCDFGCGNGLTTYSLALEVEGAECIGIDRFDGVASPTLSTILGYEEDVKRHCEDHPDLERASPGELCRLSHENRHPRFRRGDIVLGQNLPQDVDLAYCKRGLINIYHGKHDNSLLGEEGLRAAIENLVRSVRPKGLICSIEFAGFALDRYFLGAKVGIIKRAVIRRKDIRSRGRTNVTSQYSFYLCQKPSPVESI